VEGLPVVLERRQVADKKDCRQTAGKWVSRDSTLAERALSLRETSMDEIKLVRATRGGTRYDKRP
jgi:hypothetical protein